MLRRHLERPDDKTHIHWICEHCQREDADPLQQCIEYVAGVGTKPGEKISGGALGLGLSRNVRRAYRFVRDNWEPGDELFVLGFSRGAYTARSLCGFLGRVGWLDGDDWVDRAYLWYRLAPPGSERDKDQPPALLRPFAEIVERLGGFVDELGEAVQEHIRHQPEVTFLGVFDTVGSLGIPFHARDFGDDLTADLETDNILERLGGRLRKIVGGIEERVRRPIEGFHDTELGAQVKNAYHALAVDERREPFPPTLWTKVPPTSTVEQAWFAGVHGDVGGGYHNRPDDGHLAVVPLLWMIEKATALGLDLKPGALQELRDAADPVAPQHDSFTDTWNVLGRLLKMSPQERPIGNDARRRRDPKGRKFRPVEANETIHPSVRKRLGQQVEIRGDQGHAKVTYHPTNLTFA